MAKLAGPRIGPVRPWSTTKAAVVVVLLGAQVVLAFLAMLNTGNLSEHVCIDVGMTGFGSCEPYDSIAAIDFWVTWVFLAVIAASLFVGLPKVAFLAALSVFAIMRGIVLSTWVDLWSMGLDPSFLDLTASSPRVGTVFEIMYLMFTSFTLLLLGICRKIW